MKLFNISTHCGLVSVIWVNIGSGNGLLPDGGKPIPEPILIFYQRYSVAFTSGAISQVLLNQIRNMCYAFETTATSKVACNEFRGVDNKC